MAMLKVLPFSEPQFPHVCTDRVGLGARGSAYSPLSPAPENRMPSSMISVPSIPIHPTEPHSLPQPKGAPHEGPLSAFTFVSRPCCFSLSAPLVITQGLG